MNHANPPSKASCCRTATACASAHTGTPSGHAVTKDSSIQNTANGIALHVPPQGNDPHGPEENTEKSSLYLNRYLIVEWDKLR